MAKQTPKMKSDRGGVIYRALRHAIVAQALVPGTKLPEDAIGEQFGASRTIVRHALGKLAAEGLVELRRNFGASVATPSWEEAHDIFGVRIALEQLVVSRLSGRLTPDQIAVLGAHIDQEEQAQGSDEALSLRLATEFHLLLAEMTGSPVLSRYVGELASRCALILSLYSRPHSSECAVSEHRSIVAALRGAKGAEAMALTSEHLEAVGRRALIRTRPGKDHDIRAILSLYAKDASRGHRKKIAPGGRIGD